MWVLRDDGREARRVALPCGGRLINASSNHVVSDLLPDHCQTAGILQSILWQPLAVPPQN